MVEKGQPLKISEYRYRLHVFLDLSENQTDKPRLVAILAMLKKSEIKLTGNFYDCQYYNQYILALCMESQLKYCTTVGVKFDLKYKLTFWQTISG